MSKRVAHLCAAVLCILVLVLSSCSLISPGSSTSNKGNIEVGEKVVAATKSVSPGGGTITVSQTDSALNGLSLTVPANAYKDTRQFKISYAPVTKHSFGTNFNPISPLITVENGGGYSNEVVTVQIPVKIPEGHFAMAFYYTPKAGKLEGIPLLEETASSITITTRHFSDIVVSSIAESELGSDAEIDTGFEPGVDDWQFTNYGSYIAPGGHCAGQAITALWYYTQMKRAGEHSLYGRYNEGTRDLWEDDARGYRFASVIQEDVDWSAWEVRYNKLKPKAQNDNSMVWKQFVYSMKVTGEPQFIYIQNTAAGGGAHAMIAYAVSGGSLQIADPNYPGRNDREIWYEDKEFEAYNSGANAQAILDGKGEAFDLMLYFGTSSLIDFDKISARWSEFEDGTIGNGRFPEYTLQTDNEEGDLINLQDGFATAKKTINVYIDSDSAEVAYYMFRDGEPITPIASGGIEFNLQPGNNQLGINVVGDKGEWKYIDFKYINVKYEQPTPTKSVAADKLVFTGFSGPDKFEFDSSNSVTGLYKFSVSVEGGSPPYYYTWMGARAPQLLTQGEGVNTITISPQEMRQPGAIRDGFFIWVTVKDSKGNYATWKKPDGVASSEFMYALKFTGKFEIKDAVTVLVDNTWAVLTEP